MAYRIKRRDGSEQSALRRIAQEQIERAVDAVDDPATTDAAAIHDIRKRCKRIRGLLRLVRPCFRGYRDENAAFRSIARRLGPPRDADVLIETFDRLTAHYRAQVEVEEDALAPIRCLLVRRRAVLAGKIDTPALLASARRQLLEAGARTGQWRLQASGFDALEGGLGTSFRRARKAMRKARAEPSAEAFHAWRKRCKDHAFHIRLLRQVWPRPMRALGACAEELGELLGEHHDLAVFARTIDDEKRAFDRRAFDERAVDVIGGLLRARRETLARHAFALGERLFAETPSSLTASWRLRYEAWRRGTGT